MARNAGKTDHDHRLWVCYVLSDLASERKQEVIYCQDALGRKLARKKKAHNVIMSYS